MRTLARGVRNWCDDFSGRRPSRAGDLAYAAVQQVLKECPPRLIAQAAGPACRWWFGWLEVIAVGLAIGALLARCAAFTLPGLE